MRWATAVPGATTTSRAGNVVELRSCDPGAKASQPPPAAPAPVHVLELRASIIDSLLSDGTVTPEQAGCTTDAVINAVGPATLVRLDEQGPDSASLLQIRGAARQAASGCGLARPGS
jgi:hypothetical protein